MKNTIISIMSIGVLLISSCQKETSPIPQSVILSTSVESSGSATDTKTSLSETKTVLWSTKDTITVFNTSGTSAKFTIQSGQGTTSASFAGTLSGEPKFSVYPSSVDASVSDKIVTFTLPQTQAYAENSFGQGANVAVGVIDGTTVNFKNVCGLLKLQLYSSKSGGLTVKKINLSSTQKHALSGSFNVDLTASDGNFVAGAGTTETFPNVTLDCGEGVTLSADSANPTIFYFVLPVGSLLGGFSVSIITSDDTFALVSNSNDVNVERSKIQPLATKEIATANYSFPTTEIFIPFGANESFTTGWPVVENTKVEIKMQAADKTGGKENTLFGVSDGTDEFSVYFPSPSKPYIGFGKSSAEYNLQGSYTVIHTATYTMTKDSFTMNDHNINASPKVVNNTNTTMEDPIFNDRIPLGVGAKNINGTLDPQSAISGNLYYVKQWEGDNLVFDGVVIYADAEKTKRAVFDKITNTIFFVEGSTN